MCILTLLKDIFLEHDGRIQPAFFPRDLTDHYKKELGELSIDTILVATKYNEIENMLERYKFFSEREYVDIFVELVSNVVEQSKISTDSGYVFVPVPMHWSRYFMRGLNHVSYIVDELSKKTGFSTQKLLKTRYSKHQSRLSREKRLENKKNRLTIIPHTHIPERVILFDDVISTGATANECAKLLKENGVKEVIAIFLASNY